MFTPKYKKVIDQYLKDIASVYRGWEFLHIKHLYVHLVLNRVIVSDGEVLDYLRELGFEWNILTMTHYFGKPLRVLSRKASNPEERRVVMVNHIVKYDDRDYDSFIILLENMIEDGVIFRNTVNEIMFTHKDVNGYLKDYNTPGVIRKGFLKFLTAKGERIREPNRFLSTHYNPIWYYKVPYFEVRGDVE